MMSPSGPPRTPLQNRVDPWGRLVSVAARGTLIGNRGILHDGGGRIVRPWKGKAWIACALQWKDWQRRPFKPGTWTELFFLDEATAFSAGHRPCKLCRRARHLEFKQAWLDGANRVLSGEQSAQEAMATAQQEAQSALDDAWEQWDNQGSAESGS